MDAPFHLVNRLHTSTGSIHKSVTLRCVVCKGDIMVLGDCLRRFRRERHLFVELVYDGLLLRYVLKINSVNIAIVSH